MPLTDIAIRNAKPKEKSYKLSDFAGLYLEVTTTGSKLWRVKYRINGKEKRLALGSYPMVTLAEAREERDAARKLIAKGKDPVQVRLAQKRQAQLENENNFAFIANEWFEYASPRWAKTTQYKAKLYLQNVPNTTWWNPCRPSCKLLQLPCSFDHAHDTPWLVEVNARGGKMLSRDEAQETWASVARTDVWNDESLIGAGDLQRGSIRTRSIMKVASEPRKHHFLPQFYLRGFSVDQRGIFQIEKSTSRYYGCQIRDIAAIRDYHELDGADTNDPYLFEKKLAEVESLQATHLQSILAEGLSAEEHRVNLLQLLAIMRMRVPAVKEHIDRSYGATVRATILALQRSGRLPTPPKRLEERLRVENLEFKVLNWKRLEVMFRMGSSEKVLQILGRMRATLYRAPLGSRFITSDQPVALYHPTLWRSAYGAGPSTPGVEVSFPLSSGALIMLDHLAQPHSECLATHAEVEEFNRRTAVMAQEYIYTGEAPQSVVTLAQRSSGVFAGFCHGDFDAGKEFLQIHRFIPVGPAERG